MADLIEKYKPNVIHNVSGKASNISLSAVKTSLDSEHPGIVFDEDKSRDFLDLVAMDLAIMKGDVEAFRKAISPVKDRIGAQTLNRIIASKNAQMISVFKDYFKNVSEEGQRELFETFVTDNLENASYFPEGTRFKYFPVKLFHKIIKADDGQLRKFQDLTNSSADSIFQALILETRSDFVKENAVILSKAISTLAGLEEVSERRKVEVANLLLSSGKYSEVYPVIASFKIKPFDPSIEPVYEGPYNTAHRLLEEAFVNSSELTKLAFENGDLIVTNFYLLAAVARLNNVAKMKQYLEMGIQPKYKTGNEALLSHVLRLKRYNLVNVLIEKLEFTKEQLTAGLLYGMWNADGNEFLKPLEIYLENELDIEAKDNGGNTPLMLAAKECVTGAVGLLMEKGANPRVKDKNYITPAKAISDQISKLNSSCSPSDTDKAKLRNCQTSLELLGAAGGNQYGISSFTKICY
jgi:ankyrin repeat protein